MDMKLELVPVPVSNVDKAKEFYTEKAGFQLDMDQRLDEVRFVQLTPPGSNCSIAIGIGLTDKPPGSIQGLLLVVTNIQVAYEALKKRGLEISEPEKMPWGAIHANFEDPDGNSWSLQQLARKA